MTLKVEERPIKTLAGLDFGTGFGLNGRPPGEVSSYAAISKAWSVVRSLAERVCFEEEDFSGSTE